jgi:hypothetical protein
MFLLVTTYGKYQVLSQSITKTKSKRKIYAFEHIFRYSYLRKTKSHKKYKYSIFLRKPTKNHYKSDVFYSVSTFFLKKIWNYRTYILHLYRKTKVLVWRMTVKV